MVLINIFVTKEIGEREGKFYAINVPLKDGIDDTSFTRLFKTVSSGKVLKVCMVKVNFFTLVSHCLCNSRSRQSNL